MTSLKWKPRVLIGVIAIILIVVNVIACGETFSSSQKNAPLSNEDATGTSGANPTSTTLSQDALNMTQYAQSQATETAPEAQAAQAPQFLKQFLTLANLHNPGPPYSPYIRGKVVIIDRAEKSLEFPFVFGFPDDLTAATPDEVGTVIWLDCQGQVLSWKYIGEQDATWYHCDVTIIDRTENTVVGVKHFDGEYPPPVVEGRLDCCNYPYDDMKTYLSSLPRR